MKLSDLKIQANFDAAALRCPEPFFGPVYTWVWNDVLDADTIRSQIDEMAAAGIRSFYILPEPPEFRPFTNITTMSPPYLSEAFFALVRLALDYACSRGMVAWLYDEGGWPSGTACGHVIAQEPGTAAKTVRGRPLLLPAGKSYQPASDVIAAFCDRVRVRPGERFATDMPLVEYCCLPITAEKTNLTDLVEKTTGEAFVRLTHQRYTDALPEAGTDAIPCMFTDEPTVFMPAFPSDFAECFFREYGYDIRDYMYVLTDADGLNEQETRARQDYGRLVGRLMEERYLGPIRDFCRAHGLISTGHLDRDHVSENGVTHGYGSPLARLRCLDMPGVDVIWRQIFPAENPVEEGNSFFVRLAPSAAAQLGHRFAVSESFAVYGAGLSPAEMRWVINYQMVRGIQIFNLMVTPYGRTGHYMCGKRPCFCREMPGFEHLARLNSETARSAYLMSLGVPDASCALLHPAEELWGEKKAAAAAAAAYHALGEQLEQAGVDFDIIDTEGLAQAVPQGGGLRLGSACYHKIYMPAGVTPGPALAEKLAGLDGRCAVFAVADRSAFRLRTRSCPDGARVVMVYNQSLERQRGTVKLDTLLPCTEADITDGGLYRLDAVQVDGCTHIPLELEAGQARYILATPQPPAARERPVFTRRIQAQPLACRRVARLKLSRAGMQRDEVPLALPVAGRFAELCGSEFSGEVEYTFRFALTAQQAAAGAARLVLDKVEHSCNVRLNGMDAGCMTAAPWALPLPLKALQTGENTLEITVANTAANCYAATDCTDWWSEGERGPYHERTLAFERQRADGGLYGPVAVELAE